MSTPLTRHLGRLAAVEAGAVPDDDLVSRFAAGRDPAAFEVLVWRHGPMVWGVCRRVLRHTHDAEDAFQATFLALAREAGRVRGVAGWLHRAAFHVALKAKARNRPVSREAQPSAEPPDEAVAWREVGAILDDEVARLPDRYRAAFVLCCLEGLPNSDAARQLGCPTGTIDSRLSWARQRLRDRLTRRGVALGAVAAGTLPPELARAAGQASSRADLLPLATAGVRAMNRSWVKAGVLLAGAVAVAGVALATVPPPPIPETTVPVVAPVPAEKPENRPVSLLLIEGVPDDKGTITTRRLVRVRFRAGIPDKPEVIHTDQWFHVTRVVEDRYVVTEFGMVLDLTTGKLIHEPKHGELLAVEGGKVVYRVDSFGANEGVFAFNLTTRKVEMLARIGEGLWHVGTEGSVRSPDGKAVVSVSGPPSRQELKVYRAGADPVSLGADFTYEDAADSAVSPLPVLWLDADRILTQTGNGKLVVVDTQTKARTPMATIKDVRLSLSAPTLTRDPDGRIVYTDWLYSWSIDVAKKTAERVGYRSLGHGFEAMRTPPWVIGWAFRYKGTKIGEFADGTTPLSDIRATDYYVAAVAHGEGTVVVPGAEPEKRPGVRVWSVATQKWVTLDVRANSLVGWVK